MSSASGGSDEPNGSSASQPDDLPAVDFTTFVMSLSHSALLHLGDAPHPELGEKSDIDLPMARQTIDLLALIQEKTHGNLTGGEEQVLSQSLYDLRVRFVEVSQKHK